jgi:hypothetical protein
MGEIADYYREFTSEGEFPRDIMHTENNMLPSEDHIEDFVWWVTANRDRIKVKDMTDTHIINSINMIKRKRNWRRQWLKPLQQELVSRRA